MKRFTAMRTAKIASAIVSPLMLMILYLSFAYEWHSIYLLYLILVFFLISYAPILCVDPVAEDEAARARRGSGDAQLWIFACWLIFSWVIDQPETKAFLPRLKDWKPTTAMALLCLHLMRVHLRKALAFKVTDLYPHLRRVEKA